MKQLTFLFIATLFSTAVAFGQKSVPSVTVKSLEGESFDLQKFASDPDKVISLTFGPLGVRPAKRIGCHCRLL